MFSTKLALSLLATVVGQTGSGAPGGEPAFTDLAAQVTKMGVEPGRLALSPELLGFFEHPQRSSSLLSWVQRNPLESSRLAEYLEHTCQISSIGGCANMVAEFSRWNGRTVRRGMISGDALKRAVELADGDDPLLKAIERTFTLKSQKMGDDVRAEIQKSLKDVPIDQQRRVAVLVHTMCDAQQWQDLAAKGMDPSDWNGILRRELGYFDDSGSKVEAPFKEYDRFTTTARAMESFDYNLALLSAEELTFAVEELAGLFVTSKKPSDEPVPPTTLPPTGPIVSGGPPSAVTRLPTGEETTTIVIPNPPPSGGAPGGAPSGQASPPPAANTGGAPPPPDPDAQNPEAKMNSSAPSWNSYFALDETQWKLRVQTPLGLISIGVDHGLENATEAPFLLIDWSGDDTYGRLAANNAPNQRVSVAIDFGGADHYIAKKSSNGNFGAGIGGIGLLFDFDGNDEYEVEANGLGRGIFGVGLLYDAIGDDKYRAVEKSQGCATAGYAVLMDRDGKDAYDLYTAGQGYGGPEGLGILADLRGDDAYTANDKDLKYPSAQTPEHNTSVAQGAGFGWRGDFQFGTSIPGGCGLLYDGGGNDNYSCGVFGQGVGYWFGTGILYDRGGDDRYNGQWYVQGAAAHFAAGLLLDRAGNDQYSGPMNMSQGAGHDMAVGFLMDYGGSDGYTAGSLALGASHFSGIGIFVDQTGVDTYKFSGQQRDNLGWATPNSADNLRKVTPGYGLFLDLGGTDAYPAGRGGNNVQWKDNAPTVPSVVAGMGRGIDLGGGK